MGRPDTTDLKAAVGCIANSLTDGAETAKDLYSRARSFAAADEPGGDGRRATNGPIRRREVRAFVGTELELTDAQLAELGRLIIGTCVGDSMLFTR